MKITIHSKTDVGKIRDHNEDSFLATIGNGNVKGDILLMVADGMGGHAAGEIASGMATKHIGEKFKDGTIFKGQKDIGESLKNLVEAVNKAVWDAGRGNDKQGMGTTCTVAVIRQETLFYAHVGDSRAYILRNDQLTQVTKDHSWVAEAVERGEISEEEARLHPQRNVITRAVGLDANVSIDVGFEKLHKGDLVLLCSDGLNSMISDIEIKRLLLTSEPRQICEKLIDRANSAGGRDNTTVVVAVMGAGTSRLNKETQPIKTTQYVKKPSGFLRKIARRIFLKK